MTDIRQRSLKNILIFDLIFVGIFPILLILLLSLLLRKAADSGIVYVGQERFLLWVAPSVGLGGLFGCLLYVLSLAVIFFSVKALTTSVRGWMRSTAITTMVLSIIETSILVIATLMIASFTRHFNREPATFDLGTNLFVFSRIAYTAGLIMFNRQLLKHEPSAQSLSVEPKS